MKRIPIEAIDTQTDRQYKAESMRDAFAKWGVSATRLQKAIYEGNPVEVHDRGTNENLSLVFRLGEASNWKVDVCVIREGSRENVRRYRITRR